MKQYNIYIDDAHKTEGRRPYNIQGYLVIASSGVIKTRNSKLAELAKGVSFVREVEVIEEAKEETVEAQPDIQALYEELGTWSAVAKHLNISDSALRKLRK